MNPTPTNPQPLVFNDFFEMGSQVSFSPFLTADSRTWGVNLTLKASICAAFMLVMAFILSWFPSYLSLSHIFLICVYFLAGIPSLIESIEDLARFDINIDVLMTVAAFSSVLIGSGMEGGLLLVLFSLSGAMEDAVTAKAKNAISSLHKLSPTKATVINSNGTILERSVKDILIGSHILVRSGQVVPLDGIVIEGASSVNLSHLTGENFPQTKIQGDRVPAGARNLEGVLTLQVTHTSADSTLTRIIQLVTNAQEARPNLQRWFDTLSRGYALSIIAASFLFAISLPSILDIPFLGVEGSIYRALTFLIAASPCALIIAIPIAYLSAISICAKRGILLKGGITLDALAKCQAVAFDKTGTLTTGELTYDDVEGLYEASSEKLTQALQIAYSLEKNAVHPIAKAISCTMEKRRIPSLPVNNFTAIPGFGLEGTIILPDGEYRSCIGHAGFIASKLPPKDANALLEKGTAIQKEGELLAVLMVEDTVYLFRFRDKLRPKIRSTIQSLIKKGLHPVMLTGDHVYNAQRIAEEAGIQEYYADLRPEDKLKYVSRLADHEGLAMIGDGVNDAPALARATVGICMGKVGSTAAIDAADVVLLQDNIELLDWLIDKAHKTKAIVRQNITLAVFAIIAASLPALAGFIPLWLAVIMHEGGTVLVGLNALRLLRK